MSDPSPVSGGMFAFLFSDIEGSTIRWERDAAAMRVALARHDALMRAAMAGHGGQVFKTVGDAFCVAFTDAADAVAAALAAQRALAAEDFAAVDGVKVRMGVHAGPVECRDDDYFGPPLNRVARLMSAAHGGQIVVSGAVAGLLHGVVPGGGALRDLGQHRLKDLTQPEHVFQVEAPDLESVFPALHSLGSTPNNLPQQPSSFIGRQAELEEVGSLLERYRVVTLAGSGGLGKTRLSLQIGAEQLERYPDGVWFVELAPLGEAQLVAETVADLFRLPGQGSRSSIDVLTGFLRQKRLLLILDNCEHLIQAAADLANAIVQQCPQVSVLASSREPLQIPGEHLFRMPMLAVPADTQHISAAEALGYPAVELFVERARSSLGRYILSDADAPSVAAICRRLDGIALAIELAAPRLKMLKPAQLLEKLDDRFRILTGGSRTALPRQQTLRALVDWSHNLLSEPEQVLMRRLAVFADGWTLDAAAAVASGDPIEDWEVFDLLASLVDKSLVVADQSGAESRYRYLETTRHYAAEKLRDAAELHSYARLASYLAELMKQATAAFQTTPTPAWLSSYAPELDNLRAALDWAFGPNGDPAVGLELAAYGIALFIRLNHFVESKRIMRLAVPRLADTTPPGIAARILYVSVQTISLGVVSGRETFQRAVELARQAAEPELLSTALQQYAESLMTEETLAEAAPLMEEAVSIARSTGSTKRLANALNGAGMVAAMTGDFAGQQRLYAEGLAVARATGHVEIEAVLLCNMAYYRALNGELTEAIEGACEAIAAARAASARAAEAAACGNLACFLILAGRDSEARPIAADALAAALELGFDTIAAITMTYLAALALADDPSTACRLQAFADGVLAAEQGAYEGLDQQLVTRTLASLDAALPETARRELRAEGAAMTLDQAAAAALRIAGR